MVPVLEDLDLVVVYTSQDPLSKKESLYILNKKEFAIGIGYLMREKLRW